MARQRRREGMLDAPLNVRIEQRMRDKLDRLAEQKGWTLGLVVREALKEGLPRLEIQEHEREQVRV